MNLDVREAKQITIIGMVVNLVLSAAKFALGILGHSQAVIADAVHSLSDMATDLLVLFGIKIWSAPADERHPYGHQRIETIVTLLISILLAVVAFEIGWSAIERLGEPGNKPPLLFAVIGPLVSMIAKEILFRKTRAVGKRIHSSALIANAWHHRSDALSSVPALVTVGISAVNPEWAFLDALGAVLVAGLIIKVAWEIAFPALSDLSERGADDDEVRAIRRLTNSINGVCSVHRIRTRRLGAGWFVDLHVMVDGDLSVREGHDIATAVQHLLLEEGPAVADVTVHIEPEDDH
ncbi:MAG: cation transporter [Pontiellaceae bacterium]|nr:cation transporter [Pontiellaceae bacterium]MBN2785241.1 cation transporter [Pontiellaceae bacterium]